MMSGNNHIFIIVTINIVNYIEQLYNFIILVNLFNRWILYIIIFISNMVMIY